MSYERELVKRIGDLNDRHEHEEWLDDAYEEYGEAMQEEEK